MILPVIMAGGTGTRFWPKSRSRFPKQFLEFNREESLLQATHRRLSALVPNEQIYIVTNKRYANRVTTQLTTLPPANIIVEPMRRDTASCIGLTTTFLAKVHKQGVMVIVPSDHHIAREAEFIKDIRAAVEIAIATDNIVTLGITPTQPRTGYGYIRIGDAVISLAGGNTPVYQADGFTEKPCLARAREYLDAGNFLWNSGIFVCRVEVMQQALAQYMPRLARSLNRIEEVIGTTEQDSEIRKSYRDMEKISIDFGIMEKANNIVVIPCDFGWDDVGSWSILGNMLPQDSNGNSVQGLHVGLDTNNCIIVGEDNKLVATLGVTDLIVVQTKDVVMVCQRERDQEVKELVKLVKSPELRRYW
ncbi:MAG: mannose-1-phosphate guanylyltransferase [Carboxydocellales bacterium]